MYENNSLKYLKHSFSKGIYLHHILRFQTYLRRESYVVMSQRSESWLAVKESRISCINNIFVID